MGQFSMIIMPPDGSVLGDIQQFDVFMKFSSSRKRDIKWKIPVLNGRDFWGSTSVKLTLLADFMTAEVATKTTPLK